MNYKTNYKTLILIPVILFVITAGYLALQLQAGLNLDIDLKGGTQLTAESAQTVNAGNIENVLREYGAKVRIARGFTGWSVLINVPADADTTAIMEKLSDYSFENWSVQSVGPALGASFFKQAQIALLLAFVFMGAVVFVVFRVPLPSFYVVLCAVFDIIGTLAISQALGINLSLATFAALLLLIGYSVDTDILLTTRLLKGTGELKEKIRGAVRTGLTMSCTTLAAMAALYFISASAIITQIASILLIGLSLDVLNTWLLNAGLLRWYIERRAI